MGMVIVEANERPVDDGVDIDLHERESGDPPAATRRRQQAGRGLVVLALAVVVAVAAGLSTHDGRGATTLQPAQPSLSFSPGPSRWLWRDGWLRSSVWMVGLDVAPGTYTATVPVGPGRACTWTRYISEDQSLLVAGRGSGAPGHKVTVVIKPGDSEVVAVDCGWFSPAAGTPTGPPPAPRPAPTG